MRILVVEDEAGIAASLDRGLTADGFDVDVTGDGTDGLRLARATRYDAIVLDIMLPGLSGHEICQALRAEHNDTPILMLTAKDTDAELAEGLGYGADDYIVKPFSYMVLVSRIRAVIRRATRDRVPSEITVDDLRLDPQAHRAWRGEVELDLSPRALSLLHHLMINAGTVVSKESILDSVWDQSFDGDANIVEVYVSRLRQAIDAPFDRSTLQTSRGLGYRLRQ